MWSAFEHRSGRVIAIARLLLASAFLLAIWLDPLQPGPRLATPTFVLIASYMAIGTSIMVLTWSNWWRDHHLALPSHIVDLVFFGCAAFLTEGHISTPFFAIFLFLVMSSLQRFGWRATAGTAAAAFVMFTLGGLLSIHMGVSELRWDRFLLRRYYLLLLSALLMWFALNHLPLGRQRRRYVPPARDDAELAALPLNLMLDSLRQRVGCRRAIFVWNDGDEPWLWSLAATPGGHAEHRFEPDGMEEPVVAALAARAFLFDMARGRQVWRDAHAVMGHSTHGAALAPALAQHFQLTQGMVAPVQADQLSGWLLLDGIDGMCADDLSYAFDLATELASQLNRQAMLKLTASSATDRARLALARDIHDSVLQLLAAVGFRLAALQRALPDTAAGQRPLADLAAQLIDTQQEVRDYVANLRDQPGARPARPDLAALVQKLATQWDLAIDLSMDLADPELANTLLGEIRQLLREMVANAARHGQARQVRVALSQRGETLRLAVTDNGTGFARDSDGQLHQPWSLKERVADLGGTLSVDSGQNGSTISITLKNRRKSWPAS